MLGYPLALIWALGPPLFRLWVGQNFHGTQWFEILAIYLNAFVSSFLFFVQFMFYFQAIVDMNRKYFLMSQLGYLISPKKVKSYPFDKYLPTMSIMDPASLFTWSNMRRVALDFGRKYFYRHEIFLPVTLILALTMIILVFFLLYALKAELLDPNPEITKLQYSLLIDSALLFFTSFHFMYRAGALNEEFNEHLRILEKNKASFVTLMQFRHYYFKEQLGEYDEYGRCLSKAFEEFTESFVFRRLRNEIIELLPKAESPEEWERQISSYLSNLIEDYDRAIESLQHEKEYEHVKILGFFLDRATVLNGIFGLFSGLFAAYQLLFPSG